MFQELLNKGYSVAIHQKNMQVLFTLMCQVIPCQVFHVI